MSCHGFCCTSGETCFPPLPLLVRKLGDKKGRAEAAQLVADVHFALASMGLGNPQVRMGRALPCVLVPFKQSGIFPRNFLGKL